MDRKPIMNLLEEVMKFGDMKLDSDEVIKLKKDLKTHPLHRAMQSVLCDQKEKIGISNRMIKAETEESDERLDNMLRGEGIVGPDIGPLISSVVGTDQKEFREHLTRLRHEFEKDMAACYKNRCEWSETVKKVLQVQGEFRPIPHATIENMMSIVSGKFNKVSQLIKQGTCEHVIQLKKRYFDARRKRRNFAKSSTEVLNEYFHANINHPYPSEEVKQALAQQCNISVAQVSNWFGNKRIRYKKLMEKSREEKVDRKKPPMPQNPYGLLPNSLGGMVNPYQMMMPAPLGMPSFNLPLYNPEMMAYYQQSVQNATHTS